MEKLGVNCIGKVRAFFRRRSFVQLQSQRYFMSVLGVLSAYTDKSFAGIPTSMRDEKIPGSLKYSWKIGPSQVPPAFQPATIPSG